jgi:hypothetical protein
MVQVVEMKCMKRLFILSLMLLTLPAVAADVPGQLPDPDGKSGDATKPVKVYILAGQSNMVGMGNLSGAKNVYTGVYFSSDPAVAEGPFQIYRVGNYKVSKLSVYHSNGTPTDKPIAEGQLEVPQPTVVVRHLSLTLEDDHIHGGLIVRRGREDLALRGRT